MNRPKKPKQVREQLQIYLDAPDKALLEEMVTATGLPRTELFRRGLRKLALDALPPDRRPGFSLDLLIGVLGDQPDLPPDFSERHDEFLYGPKRHPKRPRPRPR